MINRFIRIGLFVFCFLGVASFGKADSPAIPTPIVTTSFWGSTFFAMVPAQGHLEQAAFGRAFNLKEDGEFELLWEVSGWYAFQVFISNSGEYLVRMGNWAVGHEPSDKDLAVAFYKQGKEIKRYSTKDLVKNPEAVQATIGHYFWLSEHEENLKLNYDNTFVIRTIDNINHTFNIETGELVANKKP